MGKLLMVKLCMLWCFFINAGITVELNQTNDDSTPSEPEALPLANSEQNLIWTFNESADVSKYENFDHSKFIETELKIHQPILVPPTITTKKQTTSGSNRNRIQQNTPKKKTTGSTNQDVNPFPVFENNMVTNVTTQEGSIALLPCHVRNLGDRPVTWIRLRDWHIITSGVLTYSTDDRYQVVHNEDSDNWDLQIKYATKRDNGTYECQVSHSQGKISQMYNLFVLVPKAYILGSDEYHVGVGSTINLVCIIENSPIPPQYVLWYHNDKMMNYETTRGGVTVTTEPGLKTHSRLIINNATPKDSGNYSCRSSNAEPDTTYVFVSQEGDNTAAIQRPDSSAAVLLTLPFYLIAGIVSLLKIIF
ncbi:hemicentin-2-like [Planococcus citri]|uniref:hemicentin-2-like n=1 Tax=Planococcus citri TaxID=170843 RepID=UPI0031F98712